MWAMPARAFRPYAHDAVLRRQRIDIERADDPIRKLYQTPAWRATSRAVRIRDPFCKIAKLCVQRFGMPAFSAIADHVMPARRYIEQCGGDQSFFFDMANLQGICKADHDAKTAREVGFAGSDSGSGKVDGI